MKSEQHILIIKIDIKQLYDQSQIYWLWGTHKLYVICQAKDLGSLAYGG